MRFAPLLFIFLILSSCGIVNKAYMPAAYEPLLLDEKGNTKFSFSQSSSFTKVQVSKGLSEKIGISISETVAKGITNTEVTSAFFRQGNIGYFEMGIGTGFQANNASYDGRPVTFWGWIGPAANSYTTENMHCIYQSLFLSSCYLWDINESKFGFTFKGGPQYIYDYNYYVKVQPYLGKEHPTPLDEERFHFKNEFFLTAEPGLFYVKQKEKIQLRFQLGYALALYAYEHDYYFTQRYALPNPVTATKNHPDLKSWLFSFGFTWRIGSKDEKTN